MLSSTLKNVRSCHTLSKLVCNTPLINHYILINIIIFLILGRVMETCSPSSWSIFTLKLVHSYRSFNTSKKSTPCMGQHALSSIPCPNFGHLPVESISVFLYKKNNFTTIVNGRSILKLFKLSNGDLFFLQDTYSRYKHCVLCAIKKFRSQGTLSKLGLPY